jgi:beta-ureidopropionase / N-carbamoyl-L-amino-acid hydrolase
LGKTYFATKSRHTLSSRGRGWILKMDKISLRIDPERLKMNFEAQAEIGATGDGGLNRPALSEAHLAVRAWFRQQVEAAGLEFHTDGAGNHSAFLACGPAGSPTLLLGSHLDSVPYGGRFDGASGVLAALEVLQVVQAAGLKLPVNLEAIDFTDEEGSLVGLLGSSALAGLLRPQDLLAPRGGREALLAGLARAGLDEDGLLTARRPAGSLAGYLELHIEQGPRLIEAGLDIGIVTDIVGIGSYRLVFSGTANHAGTTPMSARKDASLGAAAFILAARRLVLEEFPGCAVNVGSLKLEPGAFNIVPARAELALEFRSPQTESFARLEKGLLALGRELAEQYGLGLESELLDRLQPTRMNPSVNRAIAAAAASLGLQATYLASGAGHDAQALAEICLAGIFFIPSVGGISHSPAEFSRWPDCVNGANVLLQTCLRMADWLED